MEDILVLIGEVGLPIGGALVAGYFIFLVMKQILEGLVDSISTLTIFVKKLLVQTQKSLNCIKIFLKNHLKKIITDFFQTILENLFSFLTLSLDNLLI